MGGIPYVASGCIDAGDNESGTCTTDCERVVVTASTIKFGNEPVQNYTVSGNQLTITETSGAATFSITVTYSISGNTLTISFKDSVDDGGCNVVLTFKRV